MARLISKDLVQGKIDYFSNELCRDFGKVSSRFIAEVLSGISIAGSVRLSEIGRSLQEDVPLIATIKRLSRNLTKEDFYDSLGKKILELGSNQIDRDSLLVIDQFRLRKKYAEKMEYLDQAPDNDGRTSDRAYWLCDVIGWNLEPKTFTPLAQTFWSQNAPDFKGKIDQIRSLVQRVRDATEGRGIIMWNRGVHRRLLVEWTRDESCRYLLSRPGDCRLLYNGKERTCLELYDICKTPYGDTVFNENEGRESACFVEYGFLPVRLPECPDRPLWLVAVKGFRQLSGVSKEIMILTTEPMRRNRKVLWWAVEAYLTSWWIQDTNRFIKEGYEIEDVRVLTYERLKNMAALVLAASYCSAASLGVNIRQNPTRFQRLKSTSSTPS